MESFLHTLLTMSAAAAVAALAVMILRLFLNKAPRRLVCLLWLVVLFRMVCPVSFEAPVSLMPQAVTSGAAAQAVLPSTPVLPVETTEPEAAVTPAAPTSSDPSPDPYPLLFALWAAGAGFLLLRAGWSYGTLRRRVADSIRVEGNLYESDRIETPFVLGSVRPRVYLPAGLAEADRRYVLLHEHAHLRRWDHVVKPLFYLALCLHWFNPLLWLAFWLLGRDIETACDQAVLRTFDHADTAGYAEALLHLGRKAPLPRAVPLAFGEESVKDRVEHVLAYKTPGFWVVVFAAVICTLAVILLAADPGARGGQLEGVAITQAQVYQSNVPVPLSDELRNDLVTLLDEYLHQDYQPLKEITPGPGMVVLTNDSKGTIFYFQPDTLAIFRENHDGYSAIQKVGQVEEALAQDPDFIGWKEALAAYLTTGRADELYALKTPYLGDHIAVGEILTAMGVADVLGPYTIELQTREEPYGVTLNLEREDPFHSHTSYLTAASQVFFALVDNAGTFSLQWQDGTRSSGAHTVERPDEPEEDFYFWYDQMQQAAAQYLQKAGGAYVSVKPLRLPVPSSYADASTFVIRRDEFSCTLVDLLSSAWPETIENPLYRSTTPEELEPFAEELGLHREDLFSREAWAVCTEDGQDTNFRIYRLVHMNEETGVSRTMLVGHVTFSVEDGGGWLLDWLIQVAPT